MQFESLPAEIANALAGLVYKTERLRDSRNELKTLMDSIKKQEALVHEANSNLLLFCSSVPIARYVVDGKLVEISRQEGVSVSNIDGAN